MALPVFIHHRITVVSVYLCVYSANRRPTIGPAARVSVECVYVYVYVYT
jgi:hypothetical protein